MLMVIMMIIIIISYNNHNNPHNSDRDHNITMVGSCVRDALGAGPHTEVALGIATGARGMLPS